MSTQLTHDGAIAPSRQRFGRRLQLLTVVAAFACTAVACGDDDGGGGVARADASGGTTAASTESTGGSTSGPASSAAATDIDPNGVVRIAVDTSSTGVIHFDPTQSFTSSADVPYARLVYDTLLHLTPEGDYEPALAKEVDVVDDTTLEIRLREGLVFSDGTPLDAEALKFGLERNLAAEQRGQFEGTFRTLESVEVVDPLTARLHLSAPTAGAFYTLMARLDTMLVSPTAAQDPSANLDEAPVGAGPFLLEEYRPDQLMRFSKNPDYWDADNIALAGVEFVIVARGAPTINALRAGEVDLAPVDLSEAAAHEGAGFTVEVLHPQSSMAFMPICKSRPPFDDVRVRQALNYALDREEINTALFDGKAEPFAGLLQRSDPAFDDSLDAYGYDPEKAKQLLADAGVADDLSFEVMPGPGPLSTRLAEVAQQQWAAVGVNTNIVTSSNWVQEFLIDARAPVGVQTGQRPGLGRLTGPYSATSTGNVCKHQSAELAGMIERLTALRPGSPEAVAVWKQAQELIVGEAWSVWVGYIPIAFAWDDRLGGVSFIEPVTSIMPDPLGMFVKGS